MSTEAALLAAVCAAPDDNLPRLVYADWLDENGESLRAEFIRAQIELAKLTEDSPRRRALAFRCRELMDTDGLRLCDPPLLPQLGRFHRGFIETEEINGDDVNDELTTEFRVAPLRRLWVNGMFGVDELSVIPPDNQLHSLDLVCNVVDQADLLRLSRMEQRFPHLRELGLMFCQLSSPYITEQLCTGPLFDNVSVLRVGGNPFTEADRETLRDHFGERVSFACERDADYLYQFHHDERFTVGLGKDHTQLFLMAGTERGCIAVFDHAGNLLRFDEKPGLGEADPDTTEEQWLNEYGGIRTTIRVKRFKFPNGVGIEDFPPGHVGEFEDPNQEVRGYVFEWLEGWLNQGKFRWSWVGSDWWLNREGEVTDT